MISFNRKSNQIRPITIETNIINNADGSCLISVGDTKIICTATIENNVPPFLRNKGAGWITSEYCMIPASATPRARRESSAGKLTGRTQEIQRIIGRSLRSAVDLTLLGERQIIIDCDVINADGGTRCASITGGYVALALALRNMVNSKMINKNPIKWQIMAISCGILNNEVIVDLDYQEDSQAETDANFVLTSQGKLVEVQASAEREPYNIEQLNAMLSEAIKASSQISLAQNQALLNLG